MWCVAFTYSNHSKTAKASHACTCTCTCTCATMIPHRFKGSSSPDRQIYWWGCLETWNIKIPACCDMEAQTNPLCLTQTWAEVPPPFLCLSFSLYFGDFFFILHLVSDWILREGQGWQVSNSVSLFIYFYHAMLLAHGMVTLFHYLNVPAVLL